MKRGPWESENRTRRSHPVEQPGTEEALQSRLRTLTDELGKLRKELEESIRNHPQQRPERGIAADRPPPPKRRPWRDK